MMDSRKRKCPYIGLERRLRARAEPDLDLDLDHLEHGSPPSEEPVVDGGASPSGSGTEPASASGDEAGDSGDASSDPNHASVAASTVSLGALARAQAKMVRRGRCSRKDAPGGGNRNGNEQGVAAAGGAAQGRRETAPPRSNKHAPMEMSSKRAVSRKRDIMAVKKPQARDPRFDPLVARHSATTKADEDRARRAYAFLDDYRDAEMKQLKAAIKQAKTPAAKDQLQRALMSMESRKRARERKDKERAVVEDHRRREKELIKHGKKTRPFYLKKSEQRKILMTDQFVAMSEKQREKVIEKKRKKAAAKEKKGLPMERRSRQ